jgi:predicted RNA-binding Zn ribbon-like protein
MLQVLELREALYAIFASVMRRQAPDPEALEELNQVLTQADAARELVWRSQRFAWRDGDPTAQPTAPLWPIARSAADLLTSVEREWVRECDSNTCRWLFLDRSRNHSRQWCDMKSCGNRQKARRFHARRQAIDRA